MTISKFLLHLTTPRAIGFERDQRLLDGFLASRGSNKACSVQNLLNSGAQDVGRTWIGFRRRAMVGMPFFFDTNAVCWFIPVSRHWCKQSCLFALIFELRFDKGAHDRDWRVPFALYSAREDRNLWVARRANSQVGYRRRIGGIWRHGCNVGNPARWLDTFKEIGFADPLFCWFRKGVAKFFFIPDNRVCINRNE